MNRSVFPELTTSQLYQDLDSYLDVRNILLGKWHQNPLTYLPLKTAITVLCSSRAHQKQLSLTIDPFNFQGIAEDKMALAKRVYAYLNRYGYVNSGVLPDHPAFSELGLSVPNKERIIVVGAGMSGLTAARQLKVSQNFVFVFICISLLALSLHPPGSWLGSFTQFFTLRSTLGTK
jgi:hypothetical protein